MTVIYEKVFVILASVKPTTEVIDQLYEYTVNQNDLGIFEWLKPKVT